ncbi:hypothetical protein ColKHC_07672 [Colletotrichum higginsianum]|nr:hypothetical protein ColKHC_07672 [Colletotrichum higginsianum]
MHARPGRRFGSKTMDGMNKFQPDKLLRASKRSQDAVYADALLVSRTPGSGKDADMTMENIGE